MNKISPITAPELAELSGLQHAFFTRSGGVSSGIYKGLNAGLGSDDDHDSVVENRIRMAQYISMHPAEENNEAEREERIRLWSKQDHPQRDAFPGDPREWEKNNAAIATLTPLGEKLLGLASWH